MKIQVELERITFLFKLNKASCYAFTNAWKIMNTFPLLCNDVMIMITSFDWSNIFYIIKFVDLKGNVSLTVSLV